MTVLIYVVFFCSGNQPCISGSERFPTEKACLASFAPLIGPGPAQGRIQGNRIYIRESNPSAMYECVATQVPTR